MTIDNLVFPYSIFSVCQLVSKTSQRHDEFDLIRLNSGQLCFNITSRVEDRSVPLSIDLGERRARSWPLHLLIHSSPILSLAKEKKCHLLAIRYLDLSLLSSSSLCPTVLLQRLLAQMFFSFHSIQCVVWSLKSHTLEWHQHWQHDVTGSQSTLDKFQEKRNKKFSKTSFHSNLNFFCWSRLCRYLIHILDSSAQVFWGFFQDDTSLWCEELFKDNRKKWKKIIYCMQTSWGVYS